MPIKDTDGNIISGAAFVVRSTENEIGTFEIDCAAGWSLYGTVTSEMVVEARHGSSGGWTDIETTPIDLTPWDGSTETFQFRVTAPTVTVASTIAYTLTVRRTT